MARNQVRTLHTLFAGLHRGRQIIGEIILRLAFPVGELLRLRHGQRGYQPVLCPGHPIGIHQEHQLVGRQGGGGMQGHVLQGEVENLAGR